MDDFGHYVSVPSSIRHPAPSAYRRTMTSSSSKSSLAALSGLLCFVLVVGGVSGLLHEWLGWIRFMGFVRFLIPDGYEICGYVVMTTLGVAVGVAGDALTRRARR
jgi:hypothetical protein